MGPILLLDKSAFQSFSRHELARSRWHFMHNLTPILAMEILADLAKLAKSNAKAPEEKVRELALKFGGGGPLVNTDYRKLCLGELFGSRFEIRGVPIIDYGVEVPEPAGGYGLVVDLHPLNHAILRWSKGHFLEVEQLVAQSWRHATRSLGHESLRRELERQRIIVPRADTPNAIGEVVDSLLLRVALQEIWLTWIVHQLPIDSNGRRKILLRWQSAGRPFLRSYAPYVFHCLRVQLAHYVAVRSRFVKLKPSNMHDLVYLYYLPFCMVFSSDDHLHLTLAPQLRRSDQSVVAGREIKADLRRIAEEWDELPEVRRSRLSYALAGRPFPRSDSIVARLWHKHLLPWTPTSVNRASPIAESEKALAVEEVSALMQQFDAALSTENAA